jgi:hypothetical protein
MMGPTMTEDELKTSIRTKPGWAARAMVVLFERQTALERATSTTQLLNGRGFSAFDARVGSMLARMVLKQRRTGKSYADALWGKALERAEKLALKYRKQLLEEVELRLRARPR